MIRSIGVLALLATAGCASSGQGSDGQRVPLYFEGNAPCEYVLLETVRGRTSARIVSPEMYERERTRVLGHEGAEVGADAVIVEVTPTLTGTAVRREIGRTTSGFPEIPVTEFEGEAVRFAAGCPAVTDTVAVGRVR